MPKPQKMIDSLDDAKEELKRVDHLIYVSLKYTRTVDVLVNIITRMIEGYDYMIRAMLLALQETKKIDMIPGTPLEKVAIVKDHFKDNTTIMDNISLYLLLRQMLKAEPHRESEYRRHVTMITYINGKKETVTIDIISEYYAMQRAMFEEVNQLVKDAQ